MSLSLALRMPRSLLDPRMRELPRPDSDGLVAVRLEQEAGLVRAIGPLPAEIAGGPLPLALTPLVEPHAHLDKTGTAFAFPNWDGGMAGALAQNQREHGQRSASGVARRAESLLERSWRYGVRALRSHVDSGAGAATQASWQALLDLRERWRGRVDLQLVALAPLDQWLRPEGEALARQVADWGGLLGGVVGPPYAGVGWANRQDEAGLTGLMDLAERLGCGLDLHIDEADSQPGRGVALLSRLVLEQRRSLAITCSHCCSMALLPQPRLERLADQMARANLAVVALPLTNQWLLGRRSELTPVRRPQAPIRSLQRAGVPVALGGDNVQDPWFPGGDGDPVELMRFAVPACHVLPNQRQGIAPFTRAAADLLGLDWDGVLRLGGPADLVVLSATSWLELLAHPPQRRVLRGGQWLDPPGAQTASTLLAKLGE